MRFLLNNLPFTLFVLLALVTATVAYLVILFKRAKAAGAKREPAPEEASDEKADEPKREDRASRRGRMLELRSDFTSGFKRLKKQAFGKDYRYGIPWLLLLGQRGSRRNDLLARAGLGLPWGAPDERQLASEIGCRWWFFDHGLVIDLPGEYVLREDGDTSDGFGWQTLLGLLQKRRPKRPIDGVILTISCRELRQMGRLGDRPAAEAERKAKLLCDKLRDVQRRLGLRYPVYVLVTGCDELAGFPSLAGELPERLKDEIFGWSSPYSIETAYRSQWVDEAFAELGRSIDRVLLQMFAKTSEVREPDAAFLFPDDLASLREPLRVYLDPLFLPTAYHEPMLFRGIYFCGSDQPTASTEESSEAEGGVAEIEPALAAGEPRRTYFLKDLFEKRIFPEFGLGGPTRTMLGGRNRRVWLAKAGLGLLAVLVGVLLYSGYRNLDERGKKLKVFLNRTETDVRRLRGSSIACGEAGRARQRGSGIPRVLTDAESNRLVEAATRFVTELGNLDARPLRSLAIPYSWRSSFNRDLKAAFIEAYEVILFKAMCRELENQAERTVHAVEEIPGQFGERFLSGTGGALDLSTPIEELPEFARLEQYLSDLIRLEENADRYNGLRRTGPDDLREVVRYLFAVELPGGFLDQADLYEEAQERVDYTDFQFPPYRGDANRRARELIEDLHRRLFEDSPLVLTIEDLTNQMTQLARRRWTLSDDTGQLQNLVDVIDRIDRGLSERSLRWIFRESFDLGPEFGPIRAMMDRSRLLELEGGKSFSEQVYREGEERWRRLRRRLESLEGAGLTGDLFETGQNGLPIQLSDDVKVLKTTLETFLGQPFMAADRPESLRASGLDLSRSRVRWDVDILDQAVGTYEPYQQFVETGLDYIPGLRPTLSVIAQRQLNATLTGEIRRSQILEPIPEILSVNPRAHERLLLDEIERFSAAQEPLTQLLGILGDARLRDTRKELSELLAAQSAELLQEVDQLLVAEKLYRPKGGGFDWWDGKSEVVWQAYAVKDPQGLEEYLVSQKTRADELAEMARPLETMLVKTGTESDLLFRWGAILEQLDGFEDKQPGNSVAALEEWIGTDLAKVSLDNCFEIARSTSGVSSKGDFFSRREIELQAKLNQRCSQVVGERAVAGYKKIASFFELRLAGRYPFAAPGTEISPLEAEPEALREFFRQFDKQKGIIEGVPESSRTFGGAERGVREFISRMSDVRKFLASFLDDPAGRRPPTVEFEVEFRVHPEIEAFGDQVIEWHLTVGQQRMRRPERRILSWTLGEPVELALRWATGSRWLPDRQQDSAYTEVFERTVTYRYENPWSLISFLQAHPLSRPDRLPENERPRTLEFEIKTRLDPEAPPIEPAPTDPAAGPTRVFIRIVPVDPETKEPLKLPKFPVRAPDLGGSLATREARR